MSRWALRRGADGKPCGRLEINTDVTERRRVEDQLRHTQKLESVGRLAGGVAHDFNNLLTVINGYTEMLMADMPRDDAMREILVEIRAAGERAAGLTRQLLAFSRKQLVQPTVLSINDVVTDVEKMLRRLIGEDIAIVIRLAPSAGAIKADAGQIQQILMNLAVNARDAMPAGGTLILETAYVKFDESYRADHPEVEPGDYVLLAVTDTGTGMTPEVQQRLFEPFFTTKPQGVGTGLGLATVYGMVKQSGGWIWVYSEVGNGTVFKIYFPRTGEPLSVAPKPRENELRGSETILVVEDQREVRTLAVAALTRYGYRVMDAGSGDEALALSNEFAGRIDMLLTDVIMPGMTGPQLAEKLTQLRPEMVVLFISGYTEGAFSYRDLLASTVAYLQKPFTPGSLAEKVRKVLGPAKALGAAAAQGGDASPGGQSGGQPD
jgi:nitrogen-specific signal transduction histidine kinase/ActR/RegA family two-component response regulator